MRHMILAGLASLVACGVEAVIGPEDVAGTYMLLTVNGVAPPVIVGRDGDVTVEVLDGRIVLSWQPDREFSPATFTRSIKYRITDPSQFVNGGPAVTVFSEHLDGSFTVDGRTVTLRALAPVATHQEEIAVAVLQLSGGTLTWQAGDALRYSFQRE